MNKECPNIEKCPFFTGKMADDTGLGHIYKTKYCKGDYQNCARYKVCAKLGKEKVPLTLYPNMHEKADEIIRNG